MLQQITNSPATTLDFKQSREYDCGPACVAFYAHVLGVYDQSEEAYADLIKAMGTTEEDGTDTAGLVKGLEYLGLKVWTAEDPQMEFLWSRMRSMIWCVDNNEHWVVLLNGGRKGSMALYFDPETGNVHTCTNEEFHTKIASSGYTFVGAAAKE